MHKAISHALGLPANSSPKDWLNLFDLTVCSAKKPDFFTSNRPFRLWDQETNNASASPVTTILRGSAYINGSVQAIKRFRSYIGKEVLYVGDNLWTDLVEVRTVRG